MEEQSMIEAADPYREFPGIAKPAGPPRARFADIELLAATYPLRIFTMRSIHAIATVLSPGYFDELADVRLRKEDRIELVADFHGVGQHATLVVDDVKLGKATVSLLCRYERSR
jgi:hypothetical protein